MASIFKRKRNVNGQAVEAKRYTIQYTDQAGKIRRATGYSDKSKTLELARKLESGDAGDHLKHRKTPLTDHLAAYRQHLEAQNDSPDHVSQTESRLKRILAGCEFQVVRDVSLPTLENWLKDQRDKQAFGIKTSNYYGRDFKSFLTWLVDVGRAETNPVAKFAPLNAETDDARERRALGADDFSKLVEATLTGPVYRRLSGEDRTVL